MAKPVREGEIGVIVKTPRLAVTKIRNKLNDLAAIPVLLFAQGRIEALILKRTKERFNPIGTSKNAQRDPSGRLWKPLSTEYRKPTTTPILVVSGTLRDSIKVVSSNLKSEVALSSPTGATSRIGVPLSSPAAKYARIHQFGGRSGVGYAVHTPQRRFLGVGASDVTAVSRLLGRVTLEQLRK